MKKCIAKNKKLFIAILVILLIYICFGRKIVSKLGLNDFSIQFWIKVDNQKLGEKYLTISDGEQEVSLIAHLQDENGLEKGLVLSHDNGEIYGGSDYLPEYRTYSFVVINYKNNEFELYLNGKKVGSNKFSDYFNRNKMTVEFVNVELDIQNYLLENKALKEEEITDIYNKNKELTLANIDFSDDFKNNAYGKVTLPLTRKEIEYSSSDTDIMQIKDRYLCFASNNDSFDHKVTLICNYEDITKEIEFIVRGNNEQNKLLSVQNIIYNMFYNDISESDVFPESIEGIKVKYEPLDKDIVFSNGKFIDTLNREKVNFDINVIINNDNKIEEFVTLLDEYYGYLIVRFAGQAFWPEYVTGEEKIKLSVSKDLKTYIDIDEPNINSFNGSNRFRDPFIFRTEDDYKIISTQAYYYPEIYLSNTKDFNDYNTELKDITNYSFDIGLHGNYSWSPECFFDKDNKEYVIYYSDPEDDNSCIYAVTTKDFNTFSSPYVFFDAGYKIIDATIHEINGEMYLFYKDERDANRICYAKTNSLSKDCTWVIYDEASFVSNNSEGPTIVKNYNNGNYYLYTDSYGTIYSTRLDDKSNYLKGTLTVDKYINKIDEIRHFSILPITKAEYDLLVNN